MHREDQFPRLRQPGLQLTDGRRLHQVIARATVGMIKSRFRAFFARFAYRLFRPVSSG